MGKLFKKLESLELDKQEEILENFDEEKYETYAHIIKPKGTNKKLYYILDGKGFLYYKTEGGERNYKNLIISELKPGNCFNES